MARDDKINMPMSTAGITRYFDEYKSNISLKPGYVIVLILLVIGIMIFLNAYGNSWVGLQ
ncbi:MAG TPA: preprotein translocase subunit Sec61beta [Candidatus Nanoarchaeia archaeon]|nr:preprotein translocase subunit Sec61beta [Candidatus Nanoarchaeia archaeon]